MFIQHGLIRWALALALLCSIAPAYPAAAEEPEEAASGSRNTLHGELRLSLMDAIAMGIENNLSVRIARHDPLIAYEDSRIAWGAYDPDSFFETGIQSNEAPVANALQANPITWTKTFDAEGGIRGMVPFLNSQYTISQMGDRVTTNSSIQNLSPSKTSTLSIVVTQPVLRNLIWNQAWTEVKTSSLNYASSLESFREALMDVVANIEGAYWDLVAWDELVRVAEKSLEARNALLEQTQIQYEVGVVSRVEVTEAEAGVAEREVNLIRALNDYRTRQDRLIDRVLGSQLTAESRMEIFPTDRPGEYLRYEIDEGEAAAKARANRPELMVARYAIEDRKLRVKFAKNQRLPQLDIQANVGYQGLGGDRNSPTTFTGAPNTIGVKDSFGSTFDNYFEDSGAMQWGFRGIVSIPIGNIRGRHQVTRADLELRKAQSQVVRLEQNIILEVREAVRDLHSAQEEIEATERSRLAAEEQYRAESIRLEQGESTPFDVLLREEDLVEAEANKITAFQEYRVSVTALERFQGTILTDNNIALEQARRLR